LLYITDSLVDGPYQEERRDLGLASRGSSNQRLIDVPSSLQAGKIIVWQEKETLSGHNITDENWRLSV
jgi:anaerobic ribonucleoside-triphosphate reductase activating protein